MYCKNCGHPAGTREYEVQDGDEINVRSYHLDKGAYKVKCPVCGCKKCVAELEKEDVEKVAEFYREQIDARFSPSPSRARSQSSPLPDNERCGLEPR